MVASVVWFWWWAPIPLRRNACCFFATFWLGLSMFHDVFTSGTVSVLALLLGWVWGGFGVVLGWFWDGFGRPNSGADIWEPTKFTHWEI